MNLVIDIGNTRVKLALFQEDKSFDEFNFERSALDLEPVLEPFGDRIKGCIIASVSDIPDALSNWLRSVSFQVIHLGPETPLPFRNAYQTKESLGQDRIAAVAGACFLYPERDVLIVDAGTAITYELKSRKEEYLGGNISPGLRLRFKALNDYTARLPLLEPAETGSLLGNNTSDAIINGVRNSLIYEVNGYIEALSNIYPELVVILTGGDAHFFDNKLKKPIFVVSNLTLQGLNFILRYNAEKY